MKDLVVSNSRARLVLPAPPVGNAYHPGDTLRPSLALIGDPKYTSVSLRMRAFTRATIMGKDRWQAGQMSNVGFGGGGMLITSIETREFVDFPIPLVVAPKEKGEKHAAATPGSEVYAFVLPSPPAGELLPSYAEDQNPLAGDPAGISVTWALEFLGTRHGFLKTDDKLSLAIPVAISLYPPIPSRIEPSQWPRESVSKEVRFTNGSGASLMQATIAAQPLAYSGQPLHFSLSLSGPDSQALAVLSNASNLKVGAYILRRARTTPVVDPESGKSMDWGGTRIGSPTPAAVYRRNPKELVWDGTIELPREHRTLESPGISVIYSVGVQLTCPELIQGPFSLSMPIFVPSSELGGGEPQSESSEGNLPAYRA